MSKELLSSDKAAIEERCIWCKGHGFYVQCSRCEFCGGTGLMNGTTENGRSVLALAPGDGRNEGLSRPKAGPAKVLLSAANVADRGRKHG